MSAMHCRRAAIAVSAAICLLGFAGTSAVAAALPAVSQEFTGVAPGPLGAYDRAVSAAVAAGYTAAECDPISNKQGADDMYHAIVLCTK